MSFLVLLSSFGIALNTENELHELFSPSSRLLSILCLGIDNGLSSELEAQAKQQQALQPAWLQLPWNC
jgi:hypothetical protein